MRRQARGRVPSGHSARSKLPMKTKSSPSSPPMPCEDDIRLYAFHLYEQSGRMLGHDLDNWLEATACLNANVPEHCSHRRLHWHVNGCQAGPAAAVHVPPNPGQPLNPARQKRKRT